MNSVLMWWQALKPQYKTLLLVVGGAVVIFMVVEIPHRQAAPLKAKIQRERDSLPPHERLKLEHDARKLENDARTALIQGLGGAALLIGLWFTWRSIRVTERNLQITQDTAAKNLAIAQDGQITERYTRAVEQLGSNKLEVRLGAIYALERIARDSERDHWPIMEILTTYVRVHASWTEGRKENLPPRPDPEIQAILTVLGRRTRTYGKGEDHRLEIAHTDLRGAHLVAAHLEGTFLTNAHLEGADLTDAHLEGANLIDAYLEEASLEGAHLEKAFLTGAHLEGAGLTGAYLEGTLLWGTHLEKALLIRAHLEGAGLTGAYLEGASLIGARLEGALLGGAHLKGANLWGAHLEGADLGGAHLEGARSLTVEQLATVRTLYQAYLDPPLLEQIQQHYPHLLEGPKN